MTPSNAEPFKALIVGGGVAALEAALALHDLAAERVALTLIAPEPNFVYRPMSVREPFGLSTARRYPVAGIAADVGAELIVDAFESLDADERLVNTASGRELRYDAVLLCLGAVMRSSLTHAITLDDHRLDEQLHGLLQDVEAGYLSKLAFVIPEPAPWPLPVYELALMTARRAYDMNVNVSITVLTPEETPLGVFGRPVSEVVERLLEEHGILVITSAEVQTPAEGHVVVRPGGRELHVDRVIAMPQLVGPPVRGVPTTHDGGFIPVDGHFQVRGLERVYAAGDAADFPVKQGGLAADEADTAAAAIAALAGARARPAEFEAVIHGVLLGGERPLYISARLVDGQPTESQASDTPTWFPPTKIAAKYLVPYLERRDDAQA